MDFERDDLGCDLSVNQLEGSVGKDPWYAGMLMSAFCDQVSLTSSHSYRSYMASGISPTASRVFEEIAREDSSHLQMLKDLIQALGGTPYIHSKFQRDTIEKKLSGNDLNKMIDLSKMEVADSIDKCETLMGKTKDRVVRSLLSGMLMEKQHQLDRLQKII